MTGTVSGLLGSNRRRHGAERAQPAVRQHARRDQPAAAPFVEAPRIVQPFGPECHVFGARFAGRCQVFGGQRAGEGEVDGFQFRRGARDYVVPRGNIARRRRRFGNARFADPHRFDGGIFANKDVHARGGLDALFLFRLGRHVGERRGEQKTIEGCRGNHRIRAGVGREIGAVRARSRGNRLPTQPRRASGDVLRDRPGVRGADRAAHRIHDRIAAAGGKPEGEFGQCIVEVAVLVGRRDLFIDPAVGQPARPRLRRRSDGRERMSRWSPRQRTGKRERDEQRARDHRRRCVRARRAPRTARGGPGIHSGRPSPIKPEPHHLPFARFPRPFSAGYSERLPAVPSSSHHRPVAQSPPTAQVPTHSCFSSASVLKTITAPVVAVTPRSAPVRPAVNGEKMPSQLTFLPAS